MPFDRELLEAQLTLDLIASADWPKVAQDAMETGIDGPATLRLAVLEKPSFFEIRNLLPRIMKEMKLSELPKGIAAKRIAKSLAVEILNSGTDPLRYLRALEWLYIRSDYAKEVRPVGTLDDEVYISCLSAEEKREFVRARLKDGRQAAPASCRASSVRGPFSWKCKRSLRMRHTGRRVASRQTSIKLASR